MINVGPIIRSSIGNIEIDALMSEEHSAGSDVTEHPVETGADITDHKRARPREVTLTGIISNTPLQREARTEAITVNRAVQAWQALNALKDSDELITVVTPLETYTNMVIVELTVPRDATRGQILEFTVRLKEIRFADSETVVATDTSGPPDKTLDKGKQPLKEATPAQEVGLDLKVAQWLGAPI